MGNLAKYEPRRQDKALLDQGKVNFLPPIKLMSGMSKPVKKKKAVVGDWYFGQEGNLGQETEFVVIEGRAHALQMDDNGQAVLSESFDTNSKEFKDIQEGRANYAKGYGWGFDYLLWSPRQKAFGVYFCQKSAKVAAPEFEDRLGLHVSATNYEKVFQNGNSAQIPRLTTLKDPPTEMFSDADLDAALVIFRNPSARKKGEATDADGDATAPAPKAGGRAARK
jgi:hypothetical protein